MLDGTFRLEVPPVLLGYRQQSERPACLSLNMSLKPRLAPPASTPEDVLSGEMEDVTRHARRWVAEANVLHAVTCCDTARTLVGCYDRWSIWTLVCSADAFS